MNEASRFPTVHGREVSRVMPLVSEASGSRPLALSGVNKPAMPDSLQQLKIGTF